jgi:stringent starvation protein B
MQEVEATSTKPYLIRALFEWCVDNGFTPYLAVVADESVQVPREFVKNGEIVLNISSDATGGLVLGNEYIEFKARFGGVAREIFVPVTHVLAIYARENGQGMAFAHPESITHPQDSETQIISNPGAAQNPEESPPQPPSAGGGRPILTRIK